MKVRKLTTVGALAVAASMTLAACGSNGGSGGSGSGPQVTLALVAYSTPQGAYTKLIKAFQATAAGKNISFTQSYGASGDQSRAVAAGLKADVVNFSLEPDMTRLVKANLVASDWNAGQYKGMITGSVVVIGTRKGNPKNLKDWSDLTKSGVEVITTNPFTSGGARWNIMAAYGAESNKGTDKQAGVEKRFTMPDGSVVVHGDFSFAFAAALQDSAAVTASATTADRRFTCPANQTRRN